MTNEQLYIFLLSERMRITTAITQTRELLPDDIAREARQVHLGGTFYGICSRCLFERDPAHWREEPGEVTALIPLMELLESIDDQLAILRGRREDAAN